jgi:hypothetical protein
MRQYGRGPVYVKRGTLVYYLVSDLMAWLEDGRVQPGKKQTQNAVQRRGRPRKGTPVENADTPVENADAPVEDADAPASAGPTL